MVLCGSRYEDESLPDLALHRRNTAAVGVEVEQQIAPGGRVQRAIQVVAPTVEAAVKQRCTASDLFERIIPPKEFVTTVRANVVERTYNVVLPRTMMIDVFGLEFACEVAALLRHTFDAAHVQPGLLEDVLHVLSRRTLSRRSLRVTPDRVRARDTHQSSDR